MKNHIPLGWRKPDARRYRFPLPNAVWEYKLRPVDFVILAYLCYRQTHGRERKMTCAQEATGVLRLTVATVKKHLAALADKGLITDDGALVLKCGPGKFFSLPNEIFLLKLSPSAFVVYAYLLYIENRRTRQCHPSYNSIAAKTGLSKNTVMKSVGELLDKSLISVEGSSYYDSRGMKWTGNNLYTILPTRPALDDFYRRQLQRLELGTERERIRKR